MRNLKILIMTIICMSFASNFLSQKTVTGIVTDESGETLPMVSVIEKGTNNKVKTNIDGKYLIKVASNESEIEFEGVGKEKYSVVVGEKSEINVTMLENSKIMDGVVVTALNISRDKKSLGYSTQEVNSEELNKVKSDNFINQLSGKVAGITIKSSSNMGGSTDMKIRGTSSISGNNQPLIVVDGIVMNNSNENTSYQKKGGTGYDYGNAASDLNAENIETVNVLKGSAATALYGSRAANGVIMITTKKAEKGKSKALGITFNHNSTLGLIDKSTFAEYQDEYGAGYGPYYSGGDYPYIQEYDFDGDGKDDLVVPFTEDASFGQKFDPNLMVYQWDALDPANENYGKKTPWVAANNTPLNFFENLFTTKNDISVEKSGQNFGIRASYSNTYMDGIMPNSNLWKNSIGLNTNLDLSEKLKLNLNGNYSNNKAKGRNSTGYSDNLVTSFRQWWQTNVDVNQLKDIYNKTGRNVTWNPNSENNLTPIYWDNPYWTRYENYETDNRNRFYGSVGAEYELLKDLTLKASTSFDSYNTTIEERRAVGSTAAPFGTNLEDQNSGYLRKEIKFSEINYDLMLSYVKNINNDLSFSGLLGFNARRNKYESVATSTNAGLSVPNLYALNNTLAFLPSIENYSMIGVNGIYAQASLGYKSTYYIDATIRRDQSSTLPEANNTYYYPSVALSYIFSEHIKGKWLEFGKFRGSYAQVGNDAPFGITYDAYLLEIPFGGAVARNPRVKANPDLKPELSASYEAGLEMAFFKNKFGFDISAYKTNTKNQIVAIDVSNSTGITSKYINAGNIENKGIEVSFYSNVLESKSFKWRTQLNFAKNWNKVIELNEGLTNLELASFQGGIAINARVGEAYGIITGSDFVYDSATGKPIVKSNGYYLKSASNDEIIGNQTPDFNMGWLNNFTYGNWGISFLLDWQKGGSIFSLDQWYGQATGLYPNTVGTNHLGNPKRDPILAGGGIILDGVKADGSENDKVINGDRYTAYGYARYPNRAYVYDASYLKLRELAISYSIPSKKLNEKFIKGATFSLVGSNLWIIYKNLPYSDPEAGLSNGNVQGFQSGMMPSTKNISLNVNIKF